MPAEFNLADLFELVADTVPDRLALVAGSSRRTYAELDERANRFGHHLLDQGAEAGHHVGILARNRAEWVESMIGCYKARTVPVNLNYRYVAPELRYVVDNADLTTLVVERDARRPGRDRPRGRRSWTARGSSRSMPTRAAAPPGAPACPTRRLSRPHRQDAASHRGRRTTGTCSTPAAPPGCPKGSSGAKRTSSSRRWAVAAGARRRSPGPKSWSAGSTRTSGGGSSCSSSGR